MPYMKQVRLAVLALLGLAISCGSATGPWYRVSALPSARHLWRAQDLHTYAFTLQRSCFCANVHPLQVLVVSDTVATVVDLETGQQLDRQFGQTIEDLFTFIQNATDDHAYVIRATYDASMGFPTAIEYDGSAQIADDEMSIQVSDVHSVAIGLPSRSP